MTTIIAKIPDTLFRQAKSIADSEDITFDEFLALAFASQVLIWDVDKFFAETAKSVLREKSIIITPEASDVDVFDLDKI